MFVGLTIGHLTESNGHALVCACNIKAKWNKAYKRRLSILIHECDYITQNVIIHKRMFVHFLLHFFHRYIQSQKFWKRFLKECFYCGLLFEILLKHRINSVRMSIKSVTKLVFFCMHILWLWLNKAVETNRCWMKKSCIRYAKNFDCSNSKLCFVSYCCFSLVGLLFFFFLKFHMPILSSQWHGLVGKRSLPCIGGRRNL